MQKERPVTVLVSCLQISHKFFTKAVKPLGIELGGERDYGIGMFFFPQDELKRNQAKKMFESHCRERGHGIFRMERSTDRSDKCLDRKQSTVCLALCRDL